MSLIGIGAIWLLSLVCLLIRIIAILLSYTGYLNVIKSCFIANSSSCNTTELTIIFTSCLTAIKKHAINYCETVYVRNDKNLFLSIKNSGESLNKLISKGF